MVEYLLIGLCISIVIFTIVFASVTVYITKNYLIPKNNIREMEAKNEKYNLYSTISIEAVKKCLDDYIEEKINNYILYKFMSQRKNYIREEDMELMIKDVTKLVYLEISELYTFYIMLLYSISDSDELLQRVNTLVKEKSIDIVANYNSSMEL